VLRWGASHSTALAARIPLRYWPAASQPADYLGPTVIPDRHGGPDDVVLVWETDQGTVGVLWDPRDAMMASLQDRIRQVDVTALINVEPDFGVDSSPNLNGISKAVSDTTWGLTWRHLARALGQPVPYWPYLLRDPALIQAWTPGAPTVQAPAHPDLDTAVLSRTAAMFDPGHATHRTLLALTRTVQNRATRSAVGDLRSLAQFTNETGAAMVTVAAEPLVIGNIEADTEELDDTVRRIGWQGLLDRADTLSVECVRQARVWDGGRHFPFATTEEIDRDTAAGAEWAARLQPTTRTAAFVAMGDHDGEALTDPATGAPAVRTAHGVVTAVPQRLPATSPLAEIILDRPIWIRTADGTLYPAPKDHYWGLTWGYGGSGPGSLALLISRLLDDINSQAADSASGAPAGLRELTALKWPKGTVLTRDRLEAARDGRPYPGPDRS
jgi:hypothetical protein